MTNLIIPRGSPTPDARCEDGRRDAAPTWHRFEAPGGVCVMTVTAQPTNRLAGDPAGL